MVWWQPWYVPDNDCSVVNTIVHKKTSTLIKVSRVDLRIVFHRSTVWRNVWCLVPPFLNVLKVYYCVSHTEDCWHVLIDNQEWPSEFVTLIHKRWPPVSVSECFSEDGIAKPIMLLTFFQCKHWIDTSCHTWQNSYSLRKYSFFDGFTPSVFPLFISTSLWLLPQNILLKAYALIVAHLSSVRLSPYP